MIFFLIILFERTTRSTLQEVGINRQAEINKLESKIYEQINIKSFLEKMNKIVIYLKRIVKEEREQMHNIRIINET